jgi:hypothetical protein
MEIVNMKKKITQTIFIVVTVILFSLGFYKNQWKAVGMDELHRRQEVNEVLVYGRLVESRSNGVLSHGGLLGVGDAPVTLEQVVIDNQVRKYYKGTGFTYFSTYKSQSGFQALVFSIIDNWTDFASSTNIFIFRSLTSLALALILSGLCYWFLLEFGWLPAISVAGFILISKWMALLGGNLFWSLWSFYFPLVVLSFLLRSVSDNGEYTSTSKFIGIVFTLSLIKILFSGYDFIAPGLLMTTVPFVYYGFLHAWRWKVFLRGLINMGVGIAGSILTGLIILSIQIRMDTGSYEAALSHILFSLKNRTYGAEALNNGVPLPLFAEVQKTLNLIPFYLNGYAFSLSSRFSVTSNFLRDLLDGRYLYLIAIVVLCSIIFLVKNLASNKSRNYQKGIALIAATGYSFITPLSWILIFRDHAGSHTTLDFIVWQMPLVLYGFAIIGLVFSNLIKYESW